MKLYFHPMSGNSRRVLLVAVHLDVPLERVVVDLPKGEQRGVPHLRRNPNGRVPVLEDDGLVLWESRAIMQYLADKTPGQTLLPTDARGRADVNRWLFWCAVHMTPANAILVMENFVKGVTGRGPADPAEVARGQDVGRAGSADARGLLPRGGVRPRRAGAPAHWRLREPPGMARARAGARRVAEDRASRGSRLRRHRRRGFSRAPARSEAERG
jgi:glutathione S-transferase